MKSDKLNILLVEDNPGDVRLMQEMVTSTRMRQIEMRYVESINDAQELINQEDFNLVLLDLSLPDGSGLDTVTRICSIAPDVPIIVLTGLEDDDLALEAIQQGAQDYLVKGQFNEQVLMRAIRHAIERKLMERQLQYLATHDPLTHLPNRAMFQDRMEHALQRSERIQNQKVEKWGIAIVVLDLDNFKEINDTYGHATGDQLLMAVAQRLQNCLRRSDTIARMGGDEFTILFENVTGNEDSKVVAEKVLGMFSQPFNLDGNEHTVKASIGLSLYPQDGSDIDTLFKKADEAMYIAKNSKNSYCFYSDK